MWDIRKILVPTDGSDASKLAIEAALDIAKQEGTEIVALFVVDVPYRSLAHRLEETIKKDVGEPAVNEIVIAAEKEGLKVKGLIEDGHAADTILKVAERENIETPDSFDKQYLRDYLLSLSWDMRASAPALPPEVVRKTQEKYSEALRRVTT